MRKKIIGYLAALALVVAAGSAAAAESRTLTDKEKLGKNLFFDIRLSNPAGQSCGSCHNPGSGFSGAGDASQAFQEGAVSGRHGNRKPPQASYASFSPDFGWDDVEEMFIGGLFWDGRAKDIVEQAKGPFLNKNEQNSSKAEVVAKVALSNYVGLFIKVYGAKTLLNVDKAYNAIADAIAKYEESFEVNKFSSKFDLYIKRCVDQLGFGDADVCGGGFPGRLEDPTKTFSKVEWQGFQLFVGPNNNDGRLQLGRGEGAGCSACHPTTIGPYSDKALFTDFSYDNIGIPRNPTFPAGFEDLGLGAEDGNPMVQDKAAEAGKFKVSTLRNIAVAPPFGHNGYFKTLKEITHFYNTRGTPANPAPPNTWPDPEVNNANVNNDELGALGLSSEQEDALVAFMMTLTDGYVPPNLPLE